MPNFSCSLRKENYGAAFELDYFVTVNARNMNEHEIKGRL
jgi:hypothetical protein